MDGSERGVRIVRLHNEEVSADVIVDRALDLGQVSVRGVPVAWLSPTGLVGPWYAEPTGWGPQRTFFGGLLTTCGLDHFGFPTDRSTEQYGYPRRTTESVPLHGRISTTPARLVAYGIDDSSSPGTVFVEGEVRQASLFGEVLTLRRRVSLALGSRVLEVADTVANVGYAPTPHAVLYHVNVGWPVLAPGARVVASGGIPTPLGADTCGADWATFEPPRAGAREQVWRHDPRPAPDGAMFAAVVNRDIGDGRAAGVAVHYDHAQLPHLLQWRVMGEGHYVVGLEPTSPFDLGEDGQLAFPDLQPGEQRSYRLALQLLWGEEASVSSISIGSQRPLSIER